MVTPKFVDAYRYGYIEGTKGPIYLMKSLRLETTSSTCLSSILVIEHD